MNFREKTYAYQLLTLLDHYLTKNILLVSLRKGDESSKPGKQPNDKLTWTKKIKPREFGHLLAQMVSSNNVIDSEDEVDSVDGMRFTNKFSRTIIIKKKRELFKKQEDTKQKL